MNRFRNYMYGRYGFDQLTRALLIVAFLLSLITTYARIKWLIFLPYLPFICAIYRVLSKNIQARTQENMAYCRVMNNINARLRHLKLSLVGTKTHKYYVCAHCKQTIRVPRGKGKICITCPKCKYEFIRRT
jgi:hypothetical protein